MISDSSYRWVAALLLCTTIAAGAGAVYLNTRVGALEADLQRVLSELESFTATVDIMIDYGNGTAAWFNGTRIGAGESLLNATRRVAELDYTVFEFGAFVNTVNGVGNMPPLGSCSACTEADFRALIAFMARLPDPRGRGGYPQP